LRAIPNLDFTSAKLTETWLRLFVEMVKKVYQNLTNVINGNLGFGDGTNADNINGVWSNVIAPGAPNTDFTITHNLGRIPVGYWVMQADRATDIYTGSVAATKTQLTLRSSVASAVLRIFVVCLILSLLTFGATAQTTNLTIQVTDASSQTWNNGTWSVVLVSPPGVVPFGPPFFLFGTTTPVPGQTQSGSLNATGAATMTLTQNSGILPSLSQWRFLVCPNATSVCFTQFITVTAVTTATITPPAIIVQPGPGPLAQSYADGQVQGTAIGNRYYNVTSAKERVCTVVTAGVCTTWVDGGSGAAGAAAGVPIQTQVNNGGGPPNVFGGAGCQTFANKDTGPINMNCNAAPLNSANFDLKPATSDAAQYVSVNGNDTFDGLSWGTAKTTIAAACAALPSGNSNCTTGSGTIYSSGTTVFLPSGTTPGITLRILSNIGEASSGPTPNGIDIRTFGGRAVTYVPNTITVTTNGTSTITTTGISDFKVGDGLVIGAAAAATSQSTPGAPTAAVIGATGASSVSYKCIGIDAKWGLSAASASVTTTTVPTVFGTVATHISSATWAANVVTVNTSSAMPFNTGTFHVMVANIISGGNQIGGIRNATIVNSTQFTYSLTGSGTVTISSDSNVMFVNAFVLTQVSETVGSNLIVLTTDVNHNFQQQLPNQRPTKIYIEGISFAGEVNPGYANGPFTITSVTSNTITIQTPYTATLTENATASFALSTSRVNPAQMTAIVWPEILVTCPANTDNTPSTGAKQYAVYADYGGGFAQIGITLYNHSIFMDMGPAWTQSGFVPPPAMNLPATPPVAAQNQAFEAQIIAINGTTLTLDRAVPQSLTSVTGYHSNGIALLNAINESCQSVSGANNANRFPVYIPAPASGQQFVFNAPLDFATGSNSCNAISISDAGALLVNGTFTNSLGTVEIRKPDSGFNTGVSGGTPGGVVSWIGYGNPMIAASASAWNITGISFTSYSNGQNCVVGIGPNGKMERSAFQTNGSQMASIPLVISGGGFQTRLRDMSLSSSVNLSPTQPLVCSPNGQCGQLMWWPVPVAELVAGSGGFLPNLLILDGMNYGNDTAFLASNLYTQTGVQSQMAGIILRGYQTFQLPFQPLLTIEGNIAIRRVEITDSQMDSLNMPMTANIGAGANGQLWLHQGYTANLNTTTQALTGTPYRSVLEFGENPVQTPTSTINDTFINVTGMHTTQPFYANSAVVTTQTAYENCNRADGAIDSSWVATVGSFNCNGNQIKGNTAGVDNTMFYANPKLGITTVGVNQFAQAAMGVVGGRSGPAVFVTTTTAYVCTETATTLTISIGDSTGIITNLTSVGITGVAGDIVRLEVIRGLYGATNTLNCYQNTAPPAVPTLTIQDNTYQTGFPGLIINNNTTVRIDNWSGGYLQSIAELSTEQDWTQPQHFIGPVTVGPTNPVAGALAANTLYAPLINANVIKTGNAAPTCSSTGLGTGGTCGTFATGSDDISGVFIMTAGSTAGNTGTITLTFNVASVGNAFCAIYPSNQTAAWASTATSFPIFGTSTNQAVWANGGVSLVNTNQYSVGYHCDRH